jgi:hypothetical protein
VRIPGVFGTSFGPDGDAVGTAVLVPGRGYPPTAPLLFFAGMAALQHRWRVEHHWWDPPKHVSDERTIAWVRSEVADVLPPSGRVLVVAKSLGTLAASLASERELPAVWLTPILDLPEVVDAIAANPAPQLLVGGTGDDLWDGAVARRLSSPTCTVAELPDADHVMMLPGDVVRGVVAHVDVTRAVADWLAALG